MRTVTTTAEALAALRLEAEIAQAQADLARLRVEQYQLLAALAEAKEKELAGLEAACKQESRENARLKKRIAHSVRRKFEHLAQAEIEQRCGTRKRRAANRRPKPSPEPVAGADRVTCDTAPAPSAAPIAPTEPEPALPERLPTGAKALLALLANPVGEEGDRLDPDLDTIARVEHHITKVMRGLKTGSRLHRELERVRREWEEAFLAETVG